MRKAQIRAEWRRAVKAQGAADLLLEAGFYEDAVSRAYYAVLHAAKAALLARDIITESHTAVRRLFGKELVQQGLLEKEWAMILAHEQDERASADYDVELTFSQEVAGQRVEQAQRFLKRICSFLQAEGLDEVTPA
ncbi:MAG: HEPN domain-containing protein [Candidatus Bipolaricaulota bacterium]|nr:HEPN domain-containing protein [Candidatus Bipolaricaulota bacterium]